MLITIINVLRQQRITLNSYNFENYLIFNKKIKFRKEFYIFLNIYMIIITYSKLIYIFLGLTILGINKTPRTKSNNGAITTINDSSVIKS